MVMKFDVRLPVVLVLTGLLLAACSLGKSRETGTMLMSSFRLRAAMFVLAVLLLTACSIGHSRQTGSRSSLPGDGGTAGGSCKNVDICKLIPQSQVNSTLGVTARFTSPDTPINMGGGTSDQCLYNAGATEPGMHVELLRQCFPDVPNHPEAQLAAASYQSAQQEYLAPGGTRADLTGVGDKAFYETLPGMAGTTLPPKVRLVAFKGNLNRDSLGLVRSSRTGRDGQARPHVVRQHAAEGKIVFATE
jgi:hypothetical protein